MCSCRSSESETKQISKYTEDITQAVDGWILLERSKKTLFITRDKEIHQTLLEREMKVLSVSETSGMCEVFFFFSRKGDSERKAILLCSF